MQFDIKIFIFEYLTSLLNDPPEIVHRSTDVVAMPYNEKGSHYLNQYPWEAWKNVDLVEVRTLDDFNSYFASFGNGSRFGIAIDYIDSADHVVTGKIIDNKLNLYDPQSGNTFEPIDFNEVVDVKLWYTNECELSDRGKTACKGR